MPIPRKTPKRWLQLSLALIAVLLLLGLAAFAFPQQVLCVDAGNVDGDCLVVLGGGSYERPLRAAELFKSHAASRIVITGFGDHETNRQLLLREGVPESAILVEPKARTTRENALFTIPLLREQQAHRVILVSSWYHSRRALRCFRHYAPDIQFFSRPSYYAFPRNEWHRQGIYRYIRGEYLKLPGYWLLYGVCPF